MMFIRVSMMIQLKPEEPKRQQPFRFVARTRCSSAQRLSRPLLQQGAQIRNPFHVGSEGKPALCHMILLGLIMLGPSGLAGALGRSGRGALKSSAPGGGAGRCKYYGGAD